MSSGATISAGRAKKDWGRCWESAVAMGVALRRDRELGSILQQQQRQEDVDIYLVRPQKIKTAMF